MKIVKNSKLKLETNKTNNLNNKFCWIEFTCCKQRNE